MRHIAQFLLLAFAFAVPWEFSLELSEPFGPVARIVGILLMLAGIPAILQAGRLRSPGSTQWLTLALFAWFAASYFWTIDPTTTLEKLRGFFQEMMIVWLVWEFVDTPADLRSLMRAYVAGSWVLAIVTIASFASPEAIATGQVRFYAEGLDPNDTARFLDLAFPMAALLADSDTSWQARSLALGFFPLGLLAMLLTASRGGFIAAIVALAGSGILLVRGRPRRVLAGVLLLPALAAALLAIVPYESLQRLGTIYEQLNGGDLNDRVNIWAQGWYAFSHAPIAGSGAGTFVSAAGLAPLDTAHNTALSIAVSGGLCALAIASAIVLLSIRSLFLPRGNIQLGLGTALAVWIIASFTASLEENRSTWLLFSLIASDARLAAESPPDLARCFSARVPRPSPRIAVHPVECPAPRS